jgi:hypothetical protein
MADYVSNYSGDQIDEAVGRSLPGGALDTGKAPSGFGYGDKLKNVEATKGETYESFCAKVDAVISTMPADTIMQLAAYPPAIYGYGKTTATLYKYYSNAYAELRGTNSVDGTVTGGWRMRKNTTWEPFEWENPPMLLGIEYRTTERYLGKPVYKQAVSVGTMGVGSASAATQLYKYGIAPDATDIKDYHFIIRKDDTYNGYKDRHILPKYSGSGQLLAQGLCTLAPAGTTTYDGLYAIVQAFSDMSAYTVYLYVEYIK